MGEAIEQAASQDVVDRRQELRAGLLGDNRGERLVLHGFLHVGVAFEVARVGCPTQVGLAGDRRQFRGRDPGPGQVIHVGGREQRHRDELMIGRVRAGEGRHCQRVFLGGEVEAESGVEVGDAGHRPHCAVEGVPVEPIDLGLVELAQGIKQSACLLQGFGALPAAVAGYRVTFLAGDSPVQAVAHLPVERMVPQGRREQVDDRPEGVDRVGGSIG